jgi:sugar phosphate isomerase/epimerase
MKVGLQTYTIRHALAEDVAQGFQQAQSMGFDDFELARISFDESELSICQSLNIRAYAIQDTLQSLRKHFQKRCRFMHELHIPLAVVSVLSIPAILGSQKAILTFCQNVNALAKMYESAGLQLAFHHHDFEFRVRNGRLKFDWILDHLDPGVGIVMDTYWVQKAGFDPLVWAKKLGPRLRGIHLRDLQKPPGNRDCPLGEGVVDFPALFKEIDCNRVYTVIEQNSQTPFLDVAKSLAYYKTLL